ncbi:hypothetical protein ACU8KO_002510 [Vibrio alginolyticus]
MSRAVKELGASPVVIRIKTFGEDKAVHEKLFKLGFGFFNGKYPLTQEFEPCVDIWGIIVFESGRITTIFDQDEAGELDVVSAETFLALDFNGERERISKSIANYERLFAAKGKIYEISQVVPASLTEEQLTAVEALHAKLFQEEY